MKYKVEMIIDIEDDKPTINLEGMTYILKECLTSACLSVEDVKILSVEE